MKLASWFFGSIISTRILKTSLILCTFFLLPSIPSVLVALDFQYFYDQLDRLIRVIDGQGNIITYDYDEVGNILAIRRNTVGDLPPPELTAAVPNQFTQGESVTVILSGTSLLGGTVSASSPNITIDNFLGTDTQITVNLTVSPTAQFGNTNLTVTTPSGMALIAASVVPLQPRITNILPGEGLIAGGTQVTLTGENFDPMATVSIGGVPATNVVFVDSTTLTAVTPPGPANAPPVDVVVQVASLSDTIAGGFQYFDGIQYGDFVQDLIDPVGDEDQFPFSGQAGDLVVVRARPLNGSLVPNLQILEPGGVEVCSQATPSVGGNTVELGCTLGASGLHTLVLKDVFGIGTGAYEFYFFRINNPIGALPINVGEVKAGSLASVVAVDAFQFVGTEGDQMILRLASTAGTLLPSFDVFRSDGTFVCGGNGLLAAERICELPSTDTYSIFVANLSGANTGDYALALQRLNGPVNPSPFNLGSVQNLALASRVELGLFNLNGTAGEVLLVNFQSLTALWDVTIRVFDPSGRQVCSLPFSIGQPQGCPIEVSGNHTVLVTGGNNFGSPASGNYSVIINRLPNPVLSSSIAFGEQNTSTLEADVDMDIWTFSSPSPGGIVLGTSISNGGAAFTPSVQVLTNTGLTVCSQLVQQLALDLVCELPEAGNYFVLVNDQGNNGNGSYTLSLDQVSGSVEVTSMSYGDITAKRPDAGTNVNYWRFAGTAGDHVVFRLNPPGLIGFSQLHVFGPDNIRIPDCQPGNASIRVGLLNLECPLTQNGPHTLVVNGNTLELGDYSVALEETSNPVNPVSTGFGLIQSRTLSDPIALDMWTFEGSAGDQIYFRAGGGFGQTGVETEIRVYGPNGAPVPNCQFPSIQNPQERFCVLDSTGTHVFIISDALGDETGDYQVFLEKANAPSASAPLNFGQTVTGSIQPSFETDVFTFSGNSGDRIQFTMTPTSGGVDPQIITIHQNGTGTNCVGLNPAGQPLQVTCTLLSSGTHTVFVNDFGGDETGTYDLTLTNP